jgi:Gluconate 2-dehydrogenase subunit 3
MLHSLDRPSRRELLNLAARAAALPGGAQFMAALLSGAGQHDHTVHTPPPELPLFRDYRPKFFNPEDFSALQAFTEILIPADDTPGAKEARCAHYIDFLLDSATEYAPEMQRQWRNAMADLRQAGFHSGDTKVREVLMEAMSRPERDPSVSHPAYGAYQLVKQLNTFAFYTSRAGTIEVLDYRGNTYNAAFPACDHPEHHRVLPGPGPQ